MKKLFPKQLTYGSAVILVLVICLTGVGSLFLSRAITIRSTAQELNTPPNIGSIVMQLEQELGNQLGNSSMEVHDMLENKLGSSDVNVYNVYEYPDGTIDEEISIEIGSIGWVWPISIDWELTYSPSGELIDYYIIDS